MDFFPDVPPPGDRDKPEEPPRPAWRGAPEDVSAGCGSGGSDPWPVRKHGGDAHGHARVSHRARHEARRACAWTVVPQGPQRRGLRRPVHPRHGRRLASRAAEVGFRVRRRKASHERPPFATALRRTGTSVGAGPTPIRPLATLDWPPLRLMRQPQTRDTWFFVHSKVIRQAQRGSGMT